MGDLDDALFQLKNIARGGKVVNVQKSVERRILALMVEFPNLGDAEVATLSRDEIINVAGDEPALLKWATEETVARLRRTVMLSVLREQRQEPELESSAEEADEPSPPDQPRRTDVRVASRLKAEAREQTRRQPPAEDDRPEHARKTGTGTPGMHNELRAVLVLFGVGAFIWIVMSILNR